MKKNMVSLNNPMIDEVKRSIQEALSALKDWKRMDEEELRNACDNAEWYLGIAESELEDVRTHVMKIRAWGQEWKDYALENIQDSEK